MSIKQRGWIGAALAIIYLNGCASNQRSARDNAVAAEMQKNGGLNKSDSEKFALIEDHVFHHEALSAGEADWLISMADRSGTDAEKRSRISASGTVFMALAPANRPPSRNGEIFDFATKLATYRDPHDTNSVESFRSMSCYIFRNLNDSRAIPYLTTMSDDPDVNVRMHSRGVLRMLNHNLRPGEVP